MKTSIIALAFAAFTASGLAQAADNATTATQTEQSGTSRIGATPKTRADVRHELVQAQKDGQLASLSRLYRGS